MKHTGVKSLMLSLTIALTASLLLPASAPAFSLQRGSERGVSLIAPAQKTGITLSERARRGFVSAGATNSAPAAAMNAPPKFSSVYTDLKTQCKDAFKSVGDGQDMPLRCKGYGGYRIYIYYSAAASQIAVETLDGKDTMPLAMQALNYDQQNRKIEWRMANGKPFAVIMRIFLYKEGSDLPFEGKPIGSSLLVKGLKGHENIDFEVDTKSTPNPNERAREMADEAYAQPATARLNGTDDATSTDAFLFRQISYVDNAPTEGARARSSAFPPAPQRIRFIGGAISAQVRGRFTARSQAVNYVLHAEAGQHMVVNVIPQTNGLGTAGTVTFPSGATDGQPGGIVMNADLTETGDYLIHVSQRPTEHRLPASFIVEVVITPAWLRS